MLTVIFVGAACGYLSDHRVGTFGVLHRRHHIPSSRAVFRMVSLSVAVHTCRAFSHLRYLSNGRSFKRFFQEVFRELSSDAMPVNGRSFGVCGDLLAILYLVTYLAGLVLGPKAASGQIGSKLSGAMGAQRAGQIQTMVKKGRGLKCHRDH